jgi:dTDP-4-dehydrorhamnose reductase
VTTILLLGKTGQVGHELLHALAPLGTLIAPGRARFDLADADAMRAVMREVKPDIIVNAAGFTQVDAAEAQPELAMQVNGTAPGIIAETAKQIGALLVHYSTTFVFDGTQRTPYQEDDPPNPPNAYGRSKLAAEQAIQACGGDHIIVRASWTYSSRRTNFVLKMLELARVNRTIDVVDDQTGAPTWARDYATATAQMLQAPRKLRDASGVYNLSADGQCTRYQWADEVVRCAQAISVERDGWARLMRTTTHAFGIAAARPLYTVTDNHKIRSVLGIEIQPWRVRLRAFMDDHFQHRMAPAGTECNQVPSKIIE